MTRRRAVLLFTPLLIAARRLKRDRPRWLARSVGHRLTIQTGLTHSPVAERKDATCIKTS